jgi:hypothetical protein
MNYTTMKFAFLPGSSWIAAIHGRLYSSKLAKIQGFLRSAKNEEFGRFALSLSTKIALLGYVMNDFETILTEIENELETEKIKVQEHIERGCAWRGADSRLMIRFSAATDALIFELRSSYEILYKYTKMIYVECFSESLSHEDIPKMIAAQGMDSTWVDRLRKFRHLFSHESTPWFSVKFTEDGFREIIILENVSSDPNNAENWIAMSEVSGIIRGFEAAVTLLKQTIIEKINDLELQDQ